MFHNSFWHSHTPFILSLSVTCFSDCTSIARLDPILDLGRWRRSATWIKISQSDIWSDLNQISKYLKVVFDQTQIKYQIPNIKISQSDIWSESKHIYEIPNIKYQNTSKLYLIKLKACIKHQIYIIKISQSDIWSNFLALLLLAQSQYPSVAFEGEWRTYQVLKIYEYI